MNPANISTTAPFFTDCCEKRGLSPITRSLTLSNLPTGTYTVNAPSKTISNVYYQASARTQSAVVNVGTTATITVTYSVAVLPLIPIIDFVLD